METLESDISGSRPEGRFCPKQFCPQRVKARSHQMRFRISARNEFEGGGIKVEISPLMSFKHLRMLNSASASKCLQITLEFIKFSKTIKKCRKKLKLRGYPTTCP
jgi:hypothetical protein